LTRFLLNQEEIATNLPPGTALLDFIRYHQHLTGTKIGCREGDCGACTALLAEEINGEIRFQNFTSCLTAIGNVQGKQVITIEGLNLPTGLNLAQQAMADHSASQCGFCTPGFVVSLSAYCLNAQPVADPVDAVAGNICRCTGYKSIEKAALQVQQFLKENPEGISFVELCRNQLMPVWLLEMPARLKNFREKLAEMEQPPSGSRILGGGTDLYVQRHDEMTHAGIRFLKQEAPLQYCRQEGNMAEIGGATTASQWMEWPLFRRHFPDWQYLEQLLSSAPIRHIASVAGNFVNASPIGDLSIYFLALNAELLLSNSHSTRILPLRAFFLAYKKTALQEGEWISAIRFPLLKENEALYFEKVCKRRNLDIASVNAALYLRTNGFEILDAGLSTGGVGPVPLFLAKTSAWLKGRIASPEMIPEMLQSAQSEISPISDVRGSESYKRQLFAGELKALLIRHFPVFSSHAEFMKAG
jgi:xanthine dehydrogenase small subunit